MIGLGVHSSYAFLISPLCSVGVLCCKSHIVTNEVKILCEYDCFAVSLASVLKFRSPSGARV